ncbi:carbohydrate ABC transporter permease [Cohnella zeiphila]|uniref:Carbohydrate ABC transporter permease n=1 Tax=Cohnella zeiphila TaxID=2761120 RepID=A0A7X0SMP8_9BACL|nr:carbohydrate ABC transporter permease [Cohnella zeiphila]MBB6732751.1 carbohydrate ABC transporter permease [Cohnella zeiphila]
MNTSAIREPRGDRLFLLFLYIILSLIGISIAYPLIYILSSSFSSSNAVLSGDVWLWPVHPTLSGYKAVLLYPSIGTGYINSAVYTVLGTILSVSLTIMMAYPLSRKTFYGRRFFIWILLFAMLFSGGLIPYYLVVKSLGMINTMWSIIVPSAFNVFSVLVAKTFFQQNIPDELYEAAQIDGCSDIRFLLKMVIPLSKPVIAVLVLWSAVGSWNSYFNALIFLNHDDLYPLQLILRQILVLNNVNMQSMNLSPEMYQQFEDMKNLLKYSVIIVTSVPVLFLYPLAQKYFVQGVMIGSVKE